MGTGGATAGSPISLLVSQGTAFAVLGHSCGGIQEQALATGFDPATGDVVGAVYVQTRCGGSGRGGGYHVTTYSAWLGVTWDFTGATVASAKLASAPAVDPTFSASDSAGNVVANTLNAVNVQPSACSVGNTTYCTYRAWLTLAPGFVAPPRVTALSVATGPAAGGTTVTIKGDAFTGATAVSFGATTAAFTVNNDTSITATAPSAPAGTIDVTVTTPGGTSATTASDSFTYVAAPVVTGLSPADGPCTGGTAVTISGSGFTGATSVSFGGNPAGFTVDGDTSITATAPPTDAPDTVNVTVTTVGGTSASSPADVYTYDPTGCTVSCVSTSDASILEGDSGTRALTFTISLSQPATTTVTVDYATSPITATGGASHTAGVDYLDKSGTVTFTPSTTTGLTPIAKTVTVTVYGDTTPEADEQLALTLSNPTGGDGLARGVGIGTILDDDSVGATSTTLGFGDASIVGAVSGAQSLRIPVTLSRPLTTTVSVTYSLAPGSAAHSATAAGGGDRRDEPSRSARAARRSGSSCQCGPTRTATPTRRSRSRSGPRPARRPSCARTGS